MNIAFLFFRWLAYRFKLFLGFFIILLFVISLPALYHMNLIPALYAAGVCTFLGILCCAFDFADFVKRCRQLFDVLGNSKVAMNLLPDPKGLPEEQYQYLVRELFDDRNAKISEIVKLKTETEDYYTLWAHQIKTPIAAMKLLLQSDDIQNSTFLMEQELFKVEQYVEMVLQYLRLDSLSADMVLKKYSVYDMVRQTVKKYSTIIIGKKLSLDLQEFDMTAVTDEKWMTFVLEQILSNSIKYTARGAIRIYPHPKKLKTLVIEDTGIGIKPEDLPRIFDRGFTGYNGRMDKKSTGIGLYLCKIVTDRLHHPLTVDSDPGKGTKVFIDFSRRREQNLPAD